ncbi:MAG: hypothetical protein J6Y02_23870 [Pseudobutyrivibrio sp.]|nr:hypothetical protein [Pseudobutyrivibrio sp.]
MDKIVKFDEWCHKCKHWKEYEGDDPCNECLNDSVNVDSHKPTKFDGTGIVSGRYPWGKKTEG